VTDKIRIGTWQGPIADNNFDHNLAQVRRVIATAQPLLLDFICFPEVFLTGYSARAVQESSITLDDPRLEDFVTETRGHDMVVLVGLSERDANKCYNTQLVIHRGLLLGKYRKTMLTEEDTHLFATDLDLPIFEAKGIKFGVVICHDTSFVEPALCLRWQGARLLFTPHFNDIPPQGFDTANGKVSFWEHRAMVLNNQAALATLLKMVVVRSNVVIVKAGHLGAGDSNIWDMNGQLVAAGTPFTEALVTAEFDRRIFLTEHWISRAEVPLALLDKIAEAARAYRANN
jgi:predicted amidohydrolase